MVSAFNRPTLATIALLMVALIATASARPFADGEEADKFNAQLVSEEIGGLVNSIPPSELKKVARYLAHHTLPGLKDRYESFRAITEEIKLEIKRMEARGIKA